MMNETMKTTIARLLKLASSTLLAASVHGGDFAAWMENLEIRDGMTIMIPSGVHSIRPDGLQSRFLHLSNNDDGLKAVLFDLSGRENITIDGNGAELLMHGHVIPFYMRKARNIVIKNLTIDWANPFYAQAVVTDVGEEWIELRFEEDYQVEIRDGQMMAVNPDMPDPVHFHNVNYIDPDKAEQAFQSTDEYYALREGNYTARATGNGIIRLESPHFRNDPQAGQIAVFQYAGRTSPAIAVQNSESIHIDKVTQYHAGAIANIFEGSRDITISGMKMTRRGSRWFSALNDATHFVDCAGDIKIQNSLFEFQGDDTTNIHGIYRTIDRFMPNDGVRLRLMHFQQLGVDTLNTGDVIAFSRKDNLKTVHKAKIRRVEWISPELLDVYCEQPLPDMDPADHLVMNYITDVNVVISGNRIQKNRARGLLVKTLGKVRIHDNTFHTPGPALLIRSGISKWYESGPVDDVEVFNNLFDQCNFGGWGEALIHIDSSPGDKSSSWPIMRNIRIHHNRIIQIKQPLIQADRVENLEFFDNEIEKGTDYPFIESPAGNYQFGAGVTTGRLQ